MQHLDDGSLRAALDGEADLEVTRHLSACPQCQARQAHLAGVARTAAQKLTFLTPQESDPAPAAARALARFQSRTEPHKEISMLRKIFALPIVRLGLATILILAVALSIPSTQAWAGQFLGLFRVQQVSAISVDLTGMMQLSPDAPLARQLSQLLASSMTLTKKPAPAQVVATPALASQAAGFSVRLPSSTTPSSLTVQGGLAFEFKVDRARAQALLDEAGHPDLVLPAEVDGALVSVDIPGSVIAGFGECPSLATASQDLVSEKQQYVRQVGSPGRNYPNCIFMAQMPSPTVNTPPNIDLAKLAEIGLEFTGMSHEQAVAFSQTVDWTSSLIIPIPKNAATYQQVAVDGVTGTLIQRPADDAPQFALIWAKNGIIYAISGLGTAGDAVLQMANSLR